MPFERFESHSGRGGATVPRMSMWRNGNICVNKKAVEEFGLGGSQYVVLFYDEENNHMGMRFTKDANHAGAKKLSLQSVGFVLSAVGFLNKYNIEYSHARGHPMFYDDSLDMYIIDLNRYI